MGVGGVNGTGLCQTKENLVVSLVMFVIMEQPKTTADSKDSFGAAAVFLWVRSQRQRQNRGTT